MHARSEIQDAKIIEMTKPVTNFDTKASINRELASTGTKVQIEDL